MQRFIQYVWQFIQTLYTTIYNVIGVVPENAETYKTFLAKQIIAGDLFNVGITWRELLLFGSTWLITILFIIFIFKLVAGILSFFDLRR